MVSSTFMTLKTSYICFVYLLWRASFFSDSYLLVYMPGVFTHLLNISLPLEPVHHLLFEGVVLVFLLTSYVFIYFDIVYIQVYYQVYYAACSNLHFFIFQV